MTLRVSIVVTACNYGRYLQRALESALTQIFPAEERELVIVDDGSTDETPRILEKYRNVAKVAVQRNQGLAAACNAGIRMSAAPLLIRLDADDELPPDCLSVLVPVLESDSALAFVYGDRWEVRPGQNPVLHQVTPGNIYDVIAPGVLFRKQCLREVGLYEPLYWEEYDLMIRLLRKFKGRQVHHPVYRYYLHGQNMTANADSRRRGWRQLLEKWGLEELTRWGMCDELQECSRRTAG